MKKQEFRAYPDGKILALTGETPKGLGNSVFIGWTGSPNKLEEVAITMDRLPPEVSDVPNEWKDALRSKGFTFEAPKERKAPRAPEAPRAPKVRVAPRALPGGPDGPTVLMNRIVWAISLIWGIICFGCLLFVQ